MSYPQCNTVYVLTDGQRSVDLWEVNKKVALAPSRDAGLGDFTYAPHQYDQDVASLDTLAFSDTYSLNLSAYTADDLAQASRDLMALLREAWLYQYRPRHNRPVYLIAKARGETNERYALVRDCPSITGSNPLTSEAFRQAVAMQDTGVQVRRYVWRDGIPGVLPTTPVSQSVTSGGPNPPTETGVSNFRDTHAIDTIKVDDGGVFGANLFGNAGLINLFPAAPAVNDAIYFGSDEVFFNVTFWLTVAAVYVGVTFVWEYSDGAVGWPDLTLGDDLTLYPDTGLWATTGLVAANFAVGSAWAKETVDGGNKFWIRCRISAIATSFTTPPANNLWAIYNGRRPNITIPASSLKGDGPPYMLLRLKSPAGGDDDEFFSNISKILVGSKSRNLDTFYSHLNAGNDGNPAAVAVTYGTDTSAVALDSSPGGDAAVITFATEISMVMRVRYTLTDLAAAYAGEYRPFLRVDGAGTFVGKVQLVVRLDSTSDYASKIIGPEVDVQSDEGFEVVDLWPLDRISIPFGRFMSADDLTGADIIFEVHASRSSGTGTLNILDLVLMPVDEWSVEYNDPVTDLEFGSSALRGLRLLDDDGGIIFNRCMMHVLSAWDGVAWPAETWSRQGLPLRLDPNSDHKLYFLMEHYNATGEWGGPPMSALPACYLAVSIYAQPIYYNLRGDD